MRFLSKEGHRFRLLLPLLVDLAVTRLEAFICVASGVATPPNGEANPEGAGRAGTPRGAEGNAAATLTGVPTAAAAAAAAAACDTSDGRSTPPVAHGWPWWLRAASNGSE